MDRQSKVVQMVFADLKRESFLPIFVFIYSVGNSLQQNKVKLIFLHIWRFVKNQEAMENRMMVEFCAVQPVILKLKARFHILRCISETSAPSAVNVTSAKWITSKNYRRGGESQKKSLTQG